MSNCWACDNSLKLEPHYNHKDDYMQYICDVCGHFAISKKLRIDRNMLAPYLFYNNKKLSSTNDDNKIFLILPQNQIAEIQQREYSHAILLTDEDVKTWYPQTFSERIDKILLTLSLLSKYDGNYINLSSEEVYSAFFVKRYNFDGTKISEGNLGMQVNFIYRYSRENNLIEKFENSFIERRDKDRHEIMILPDGLNRIYELQKNLSNCKDAFIAMSFAEDMKNVRDAIDKAITKAGYNSRIMNKIEHNNQIVPEILHEIRQSKFVVAEFTGHNNGAYYEAGYAAGLGKEVIHVCKKDTFETDGHFDVQQKATVLWETEIELVEKLYNRIKATIPENTK